MSRRPSFNSSFCNVAQVHIPALWCVLAVALNCIPSAAQTGTPSLPDQSASQPDSQHMTDIEHRLNEVTDALSKTQQALQQSLIEIQQLRGELDVLKLKVATAPDAAIAAARPSPVSNAQNADINSVSSDIKALHEQQDALQAEIEQHEQTKVETTSKYPVRITGLVLFNAFSNAGVVDDADLPTIALPRIPDSSHGSVGATMRQTIVGIEATGPHLWGARSSAQISADFFGGATANSYGYSAPSGFLRLREAGVQLDWHRTTAQGGISEPLITPLSPTSYATIAMPALSASGNLWAWSPQLRVEQRIPFSDHQRLALEAGLIDPSSQDYTSDQLDTPVEASRRPGYEGRVSYHADGSSTGVPHPFVVGIGAYSSNQYYSSTTSIHSWAVTADWQIPLFKRMEITGEAYRGRSLGGFGGGTYKDILTGMDMTTGLTRTAGVDAVGGWSQVKIRFTQTMEANAAWGIDDILSSSFNGLIFSTSTNPLELNARNSSVIGNFIFRPKTYLIFSPEYRRIQSWLYTGPANTANIFTLSAGFQF